MHQQPPNTAVVCAPPGRRRHPTSTRSSALTEYGRSTTSISLARAVTQSPCGGVRNGGSRTAAWWALVSADASFRGQARRSRSFPRRPVPASTQARRRRPRSTTLCPGSTPSSSAPQVNPAGVPALPASPSAAVTREDSGDGSGPGRTQSARWQGSRAPPRCDDREHSLWPATAVLRSSLASRRGGPQAGCLCDLHRARRSPPRSRRRGAEPRVGSGRCSGGRGRLRRLVRVEAVAVGEPHARFAR
jgi:hypothetical protein